MRVDFDSSAVPEGERREAWRKATDQLLYASDGGPHHIENFEARLCSARLGRVHLLEVQTSSMHSRRSRRVPTGTNERLVLSLMLDGHWQLDQDGRQVVQKTGDIVIWDSSRPFDGECKTPLHSVVVGVPLQLAGARGFTDTRLLTTTVVPAGCAMARLAGDAIRNAMALANAPDSPALCRVGASLLDMVCSAVEVQRDEGLGSTRQRVNLRRAKAFVQARLEDTRLCVDSVAHGLGLSPRSLSRLFAAEGTTVMRWLWHERLEASRRMLQTGTGQRVADVALSCGFTNFAHFSQAFRKAYGIAPVTLVRQAREPAHCA